jgi:hypothetical protein
MKQAVHKIGDIYHPDGRCYEGAQEKRRQGTEGSFAFIVPFIATLNTCKFDVFCVGRLLFIDLYLGVVAPG